MCDSVISHRATCLSDRFAGRGAVAQSELELLWIWYARSEMAKDSLFGDLPPPVTAQSILRTSLVAPERGEMAPAVSSILSSSAASKRSVAHDDSHGRVWIFSVSLCNLRVSFLPRYVE